MKWNPGQPCRMDPGDPTKILLRFVHSRLPWLIDFYECGLSALIVDDCNDSHVLQWHKGYRCSNHIDCVPEKFGEILISVHTVVGLTPAVFPYIVRESVPQPLLPLLFSILVSQCWQFFSSYSKCIFLSCSIHNRWSTFVRVLRYRLLSIVKACSCGSRHQTTE